MNSQRGQSQPPHVPYWLLVATWTAMVFYFIATAFPLLENPPTDFQPLIARFIGPLSLLALSIILPFLDLMLRHRVDIETWVFVASVIFAGGFFLAATFAHDAVIQERLFAATWAIAGFAVGLKIGGRIESAHDDTNPSQGRLIP